jgi:hypothetical protein
MERTDVMILREASGQFCRDIVLNSQYNFHLLQSSVLVEMLCDFNSQTSDSGPID